MRLVEFIFCTDKELIFLYANYTHYRTCDLEIIYYYFRCLFYGRVMPIMITIA